MPTKAWKKVEQDVARLLQRAAGRVKDRGLLNLVSSIGRVGHTLQIDIAVGNEPVALMGEAKRRALPKWITDALAQAQRVAHEWGRIPFFALALNSDIKVRTVKTHQGSIPLERTWIAFPKNYAAELVLARRLLFELMDPDYRPTEALSALWREELERLHRPGTDPDEQEDDSELA